MIGRAVPRLGEETEPKKISRFFSNLPIHKFDAALAGLLEKNLRKTRVILLRVDNGVSGVLQKIKLKGGISGVHEKKRLFFSVKNELEPTQEENSTNEEIVGPGTEV